MTNRLDEIYLLKNISLEEIFENNEIDELLRDNLFWNTESSEEEQNSEGIMKKLSRFKKNKIKFDRGSLVMNLLSVAIEKIKDSSKVIAKGLNWVKKELQGTLLCANTNNSFFKRQSSSSKADFDIKNIVSWIEDPVYESNIVKTKKNDRRSTMFNLQDASRIMKEPLSMQNKINSFTQQRFSDKVANCEIKEFILGDEKEKRVIKNKYSTSSEKFIIKYDNLHTLKSKIYNEDIMDSINKKDFDIFKYEKELGRDNILSSLTFQIFFNFDLYTLINLEKMENFIFKIRDGYVKTNPYHHDLHAADVLQTCYSIIVHSNIREILECESYDVISFFIAAIIHDYKHPGLTNGFLINTKDKLAIHYNGKTIILI